MRTCLCILQGDSWGSREKGEGKKENEERKKEEQETRKK